MKTSTEINSASKIIGFEKAVEFVAKAGFDAWDFSMFAMIGYDYVNRRPKYYDNELSSNDYAKFAKRLKQIGLDNGIRCNQSHAPFPSSCAEIRDYLKRAIECTAIAGGDICVIHPDNDKSPEENAEMYFKLLEFSKPMGVKIACENMFNYNGATDTALFAACSTPDSFVQHLNAVNDDYFVACLDIGHAEMRDLNAGAVNMINALGSKLKALHVHDNDLKHDRHQIPFSMNIDFNAVIKALKQNGYDGYLTLEADAYIPHSGDVFEDLKKMSAVARKLANAFEKA